MNKYYRLKQHAYAHKRLDLVSLRKFAVVKKVLNTV